MGPARAECGPTSTNARLELDGESASKTWTAVLKRTGETKFWTQYDVDRSVVILPETDE